jgi:hypothetical protein
VTSQGPRREDPPAKSQESPRARDPVTADPGAPVRAPLGQLGSQFPTRHERHGENMRTAGLVLEPVAPGGVR